MRNRMTSIGLLAAALLLTPTPPATADEAMTLDQAWADLGRPEPLGTRALLRLSATPDATVAFLKDHPRPLTLTPEDLAAKIKDLGSDDEKVWRPAFEYLQYFDPRLATNLPALMADTNEPTARTRLVEVLGDEKPDHRDKTPTSITPVGDAYNFVSGNGSWWAEDQVQRINMSRWGTHKVLWTRAVRAVVLLRHIGTPDALAIVADMAGGHPDALSTRVAKGEGVAGD